MSMTEHEIDHSLDFVKALSGAVLTSLCYDERALQLKFEKHDTFWWLTFSLKPGYPYFFLSSERIYLVKNLKKPLALFLKTHFFGQELKDVFRVKESGRIIELIFSEGSAIKATLFPGGQNIEAFHEGKSLFSFKPKEEKAHEVRADLDLERREPSFFLDRWQKQKLGSLSEIKKSSVVDQNKKDLKKKENGLRKMKEKLSLAQGSHWLSLGNWLKENQTLENVPCDQLKFINSEKSLSWNIENCFKQYKKNQGKLQGTIDRIAELEKEIELLKSGKVKKAKAQPKSLMVHSEAKGRTFDLGEGKLYVGKSVKDNLTLLRKAKPWFRWLHIRDYPGAYGIIECQKKQGDLPLEMLQKAALLVTKQSVGEKAEGKYQVLIAECRFVKPIKGAKSGQVTYSHEKVITIRV